MWLGTIKCTFVCLYDGTAQRLPGQKTGGAGKIYTVTDTSTIGAHGELIDTTEPIVLYEGDTLPEGRVPVVLTDYLSSWAAAPKVDKPGRMNHERLATAPVVYVDAKRLNWIEVEDEIEPEIIDQEKSNKLLAGAGALLLLLGAIN